MKYIIILIVFLSLINYINSQCSANAPKSPLCSSEPVVGKVTGDCSSQVVSVASREPCCQLESLALTNGCASASDAACRTVELNNAICGASAGNARCSKMSLKFKLEVEKKTGTCCETCACWGDPHCEAFSGKNDTWIICDSRKKSGKNDCSINKGICDGERDHNGNPCKWVGGNGKSWNVGLQGSQCVFDQKNQDLPFITMYVFEGFSAIIDLGERGVITQLKLKSKTGEFYLAADNCFNGYVNGVNPWRAVEGAPSPPIDSEWLPYQWPNSKIDGGDLTWAVSGLEEGILVNVRCTRTPVVKNGQVKFGPPRLNIESIVEPVPINQRKNPTGFCVTDKINKQLSTVEHTNKIEAERTCADAADELAISKLLCSKGVSRQSILNCKKKWCDAAIGKNKRQRCLDDIKKFKWRKVFCAANTVISQKPTDCKSGLCAECMTDIGDFGWAPSILKYSGKLAEIVDDACLTAADLPPDLVSCQRGILLQYELAPGVWTTHKAIPSGSSLCDGELTFSSETDAPLFNFPIRVSQCGVDPSCGRDMCNPEDGFKASFEFIAEEDQEADLLKLVESNDLICNPLRYPNDPQGCLDFKPPPMCPC